MSNCVADNPCMSEPIISAGPKQKKKYGKGGWGEIGNATANLHTTPPSLRFGGFFRATSERIRLENMPFQKCQDSCGLGVT